MGLMDRARKNQGESQAPKKTRSAKKTVAKTEVSNETNSVGKINASAYHIIVKPLVTEKSAVMQANNKYAFVVARSAKKNQIKEAVKALYGVVPVGVNVINVQGQRARFGRNLGRRSDFKKAIVTLPAGKSIVIHEGV